ncbi:IS481 family transposase [Granulicella mallensis]|uniref:Transposase InsO family protein n=1 Tax=Granulicella mallensis TaxID=940614 RepID=A0A7W8ECJ5_9BACT|nr:IS481 family transposase [Granulicella mallensis]MBB5065690.1 transposase InsO family protein [Granulicella mallensis]
MAWRTMEVADQRIRFVVAASRGESSLTELCKEFEISRPTGYLWLKRYRAGGVSGVAELSRRPHRSPERTAESIERRIAELRRERPDWGARKLAVLLGQEGIAIPAATVHRVLLRQGLVRLEDRHRPALRRFEREHPNQLWQMDHKSPKGWNQSVGPLSIVDDASRYVIALDGLGTTRGEAVQQRLEAAFITCGMPEAMLMDHGIPWWNGQSAGGWTQLSIWLMQLGIRLYFSGIRHPQTQGKVERFHGALEMARRRRGLPEPELRQAWLDAFRHEYNHLRPHEALGMKTPASRWHKSNKPYDPNPPAWQYPTDAVVQCLEPSGQLKLDGRRWQVCGPLAGQPVQLVRIEQRVLVFYRSTLLRELDLASQGSAMAEP